MSGLGGGMHLYAGGNRALRIALLISVALHALLLFALPGLSESQRRGIARVPLVAHLMQPRVESAAAPAAAIPETRTPVQRPAAKPSPRARSVPERAPVPPTPQVARAAADLPNTEVAIGIPAASITAAASVAPIEAAPPDAAAFAARGTSQSAPAAEEAPDAGTLAQYRLAIISAARGYKRYPRAALDNNWQGRVEVHMVIGANGAISTLSVRSSAGHPVLDQQALEMIERAKATAQIPPALRGREFTVDIPVIFSLREPNA